MFGIGRQDAGPGLRGTLHEEIAGADQAFLVGQGDGRAPIDGGERGFQSGGAADRGHHPLRRPRRSLDHGALPGPACDRGAGQRLFQLGKPCGIGDRRKFCAELLRKLGQALHIGIRRERFDPIAVGRGTQQIHRTVADRAGGTENRHAAHGR